MQSRDDRNSAVFLTHRALKAHKHVLLCPCGVFLFTLSLPDCGTIPEISFLPWQWGCPGSRATQPIAADNLDGPVFERIAQRIACSRSKIGVEPHACERFFNLGARWVRDAVQPTARLQKLEAFRDEVSALRHKLDDSLSSLWRRSKRAGVALRSSGGGGGREEGRLRYLQLGGLGMGQDIPVIGPNSGRRAQYALLDRPIALVSLAHGCRADPSLGGGHTRRNGL